MKQLFILMSATFCFISTLVLFEIGIANAQDKDKDCVKRDFQCFYKEIEKSKKDKPVQVIKGLQPPSINRASIDIGVLAGAINKNLDEFKKMAIKDALVKIAVCNDDDAKENKCVRNLVLKDILTTTADEVFSTNPSLRQSDKLTKAITRYALTVAFAKLIELDAGLDNIKKNNTKISSNMVYIALVDLAKDIEENYISLNGKAVNLLENVGFQSTQEINDMREKIDRNALNSVKEAIKNYIKFASNIECGKGGGCALNKDVFKKMVEILDADQQSLINDVVGSLVIIHARGAADGDKQERLEAFRTLAYTSIDFAMTKCKNEVGSKKTICELPKTIARAVLDNIIYDVETKKYTFDVDKAAYPFLMDAGALGGKNPWFFHLVIGTGSAYIFDSKVSDVKGDWSPIVSEQIGLGYRIDKFSSANEKFVSKGGVYVSGILNRIVFNNQESDGVMGGVFFAVDVYKTIQFNIAYLANFVPRRDGSPSRIDRGVSFGVYIPLGEYLKELASN